MILWPTKNKKYPFTTPKPYKTPIINGQLPALAMLGNIGNYRKVKESTGF